MGCCLDSKVSYDQGNQYERESTWRLNVDLLNARGVSSIDIIVPEHLQLKPGHRARMREIIDTCNQKYADWGFKDPRTCLVYPLWASELPEHRLIVIYRSLSGPWPHYQPNHLRNRYREPYRAWKYLRAWCEHNRRILTYLQETRYKYVVLEYEQLVTTQTEFDRLHAFVGRPLDDRRKPALYRNRTGNHLILSAAARLFQRKEGYHPKEIMQQLEELRQ